MGANVNLILNGCECEPYLTSDYRTMLEFPEKILEGLKIIMRAVGAERGIVGIEDNKPDAIEKMSHLADNESNINVQAVKTKYPQGAEKMLVSVLTGRRIPPGDLPFSIGVVVSMMQL
jgi:electron transport complex protein RnfC